MTFTKTHLVVFLIVIISMLFAPTTNAIATKKANGIRTPEARVRRMCKTLKNPMMCYDTILPKAESTPKFNIYKALEVETQETSIRINKTIKIMDLRMTPSTIKYIPNNFFPHSEDNSLPLCRELYGKMLKSITAAVASVAKRNAVEARTQLLEALSYHFACDKSYGDQVSVFYQDALKSGDLASNSLGLAEAIINRVKPRP